MTTSSFVTTNAECCFPNSSPKPPRSEKQPAPLAAITVIATRISLRPPRHAEDCAAEVVSDIKGVSGGCQNQRILSPTRVN